jgi:hypothetical protein
MPGDTSKRIRTESARKCEDRENIEAIKFERTEKRANVQAGKDLRDEAAEDGLLVEREGESPEFTKLRCMSILLLTHLSDLHVLLLQFTLSDSSPAMTTCMPNSHVATKETPINLQSPSRPLTIKATLTSSSSVST